jgi:hypothetical protein
MLKPSDRYDPATAEELAAFLGKTEEPGGENFKARAAREAAEKVVRLLAVAEAQPGPWRILIQFIGEQVRQLADATAGVNPTEEPAKVHGYQCFKAGGAQALTELAISLLPENLGKRLDKLKKLCDNNA